MPHANKSFYDAVRNAPALTQVLERHGFRSGSSGQSGELDSQRSGDVLKLSKKKWLIRLDNNRKEGVHVHFECAADRSLHLHIETYPYVGRLAERPDVLSQRSLEIELRTALHGRIRQELPKIPTIEVKKPRFPPEDLKANSAGSFPSDLPADYTPESYAAFVARIIDAVVPTVDRCIDEVMKTPADLPD
jgi:hypothetical protein